MKTGKRIRQILLIILSAIIFSTLIFISAGAQSENQTTVSFAQQFRMGNVAVTDYNTTDGISLYSKSYVRHEQQTPDRTIFTYEGTGSDYPRISNSNGIYISGTYDLSTIVFFVKETQTECGSMVLNTSVIDEVEFFADIQSESVAVSSVSMLVTDGENFSWRKIFSADSSDVKVTDINYYDCPFDEDKNAYMVALRVDNGMTCFSSIQLSDLEIVKITDCRKPLFYENGVLMQGAPDTSYTQADAIANFNLDLISNAASCDKIDYDYSDPVSPLTVFLRNFYNFLVRVSTILLSIFR